MAYPTLAEARAAGLFHPNCRHSVSIFIEGISTTPKTRTPAEIQSEQKLYQDTQKLNYINRQIQKWKNRKEVAFDQRDIIQSKAKLKEWYAARHDLMVNNPRLTTG
jgi:hypothetical protein